MLLKYLMNCLTSFGEPPSSKKVQPNDIIHSLDYSSDGQYIAAGDGGGRIVIFIVHPALSKTGSPKIQYAAQFRVHREQFDYFRSELSDTRVQSLHWLRETTIAPRILTCNSHDAHLFKFIASPQINWTPLNTSVPLDSFVLPIPSKIEPRYGFSEISSYNNINVEYCLDVQLLPSQDSFFMLDLGGVKLWDLNRQKEPVSLINIKSKEPELTALSNHPFYPFLFFVADDSGMLRSFDMRQQAQNLTPALSFNAFEYQTLKDFPQINTLKMYRDGNFLIARSLGDLQIWDIRKNEKPFSHINIQNFQNQNKTIEDSMLVYDVWKSTVSDDDLIYSGKFGNSFVEWDWKNNKINEFFASNPRKPAKSLKIDFTERVTCCKYHRQSNLLGIASTSSLFCFKKAKPTKE